MAAPQKKKKAATGQDRTFTFTFTMPEVIGLGAGAVAALCAFFVLGILLGRGYQPEKDVPELAMMMPSQTNHSGEIKGGVLKPEELQYMDQLKKKPESAVRPAPAKEEQKPEPKKTAPVQQSAAEPDKQETPVQSQAATPAPAAPPVETESAVEIDNPAEVTGPVYAYVYQAASFGDEARAREFGDKLAGAGLNSFVEAGKSGNRTWYRVFIRHTGTPDSTNVMKDVLRKFGIKKPLLKSKSAAQ